MTPPASPVVFTDRVRRLSAGLMRRAGMAVHRLGIHPDWITIAGLVLVLIGSVAIAQGSFVQAGVLLLLSLPLDALDGAVARAMQRTDRRGGVLDSTLDRYADSAIFTGFAWYFAVNDAPVLMLLAIAGMIGTSGVSYVRARAGEAGLSVRVGLFSRLERVVVMLVMLFIPALIVPGLWVLAIGTNFTTLQRLWYVYRHLDR
jgi:CDP-diacylglycerol--glycerol-3-phosphate 3-phosphatidyltransferase